MTSQSPELVRQSLIAAGAAALIGLSHGLIPAHYHLIPTARGTVVSTQQLDFGRLFRGV